MDGQAHSTSQGIWLLPACSWGACWIINLVVGWKQKRAAGGTFLRWQAASAYLAGLSVLPLALAAMSSRWQSNASWDDTVLVATAMSVISALYSLLWFGVPYWMLGAKAFPPPLTDADFLARLTELAARMKLRVPFVRICHSISSSQMALAFVSTLHAPQVVVTDGCLHRLTKPECDAILAHELGHIANGSMWWLAAVMPLGCLTATAGTLFLPPLLAIPYGMAAYVGLSRLVMRAFEIDCDRRAGRAIGFRATVSALAKIHAAHRLSNSGIISLLCYATASHPSRDVRLWSLKSAAPVDDVPDVEINPAIVRRHRSASVIAFLIWMAVMATTFIVSVAYPARLPKLVWLLYLTALLPMILLTLAQRKFMAQQRRLREPRSWRRVAGITLLAGAFVTLYVTVRFFAVGLDRDMGPYPANPLSSILLDLVLLLFILTTFLTVLIGPRKRRRLRQAVTAAMQNHEFERALELGAAQPRVVARDHILQHNLALAEAICGRREQAIAKFENVWRVRPRFPPTNLALCELYLEAGKPELTLKLAEAAAEWFKDPSVHVLAARALRRLGRLDDATAACRKAEVHDPGDGLSRAFSAVLALERGDQPGAQQLIREAEELSPGDTFVQLCEAEIALKTESPEQARETVERTLAAAEANPYLFMRPEVSRLRESLARGAESD